MPEPELIAPLVFDQDTLGVIVLSKPRKSGDPKAALRLVTQTGAQVLHTAAQVSRMKTTAEMDGLTRIYNKKHLEQTLNELIYRAACAAYDQRSAGRRDARARCCRCSCSTSTTSRTTTTRTATWRATSCCRSSRAS